MKSVVFLAFFILIGLSAGAASFESQERKVTLLELYSSEGCSSCPPADQWVRQFLEPSNLWKDFVPVVFHVDYWDRLGWKDPYANPKYTERQEDYAQHWKSSSLFTPNVVINGKSWNTWRGIKSLPIFKEEEGVLKADQVALGNWKISFSPKKPGGNHEAHLALLGFDLETSVERGENSGRQLKHDFVVLQYQRGLMRGSPEQTTLNLNMKDVRAKKQGVAVWVSEQGSPVPIQATGGYL